MLFRFAVFRLSCALVFTFATLARVAAGPFEILPPDFRGAIQPQIAVTPAGRVHVAFGRGTTIFHTASEDGGRSFSKPVRVGELPKLALGMHRGPRVSATDKIVAITAISHADGNLHAWTSADGGKQWSESAPINDVPNSAREGLHAMAGDGGGDLFAAWLDLRNGGTELWGAASHDGGASWGANARIYQSPDGHICECCHPSVAFASRGTVAVMWRNWISGARDMYLAISNDRGTTFAAAQKLGTGTWKLQGCPMDGGSITFTAAGEPLSVWRRESTVFGSAVGEAERRLADSATQPLVITGKEGPCYLWESGGNLMLKKGDSSPTRLAEKASFAAAASRPGQGPVIVWEGVVAGNKTLFAELIN